MTTQAEVDAHIKHLRWLVRVGKPSAIERWLETLPEQVATVMRMIYERVKDRYDHLR